MVYDFFYVLLDLVYSYFVQSFCIYIHQRYRPIIFLFGNIFVWFWYQGVGGFIECLWEYSLFSNLLEEFEKDQYRFLFVCWVKFTMELSGSGLLFVGSFSFKSYISLLFIGLFKLSISS